MKNCFTKIFIAFIIAVTTVQCSSDDNKTDATDTKKLIKLVNTAYYDEAEIREDGVYTMDFVYDKNKVAEIKLDFDGPTEKYNYKTVYTYTGEKLKSDKTYLNGTLSGEATYTYNGNLMSQIEGYDRDEGDYFQTFEYDANGFLSKYTQKYIKSSYQEIRTFENDAKGNILRDGYKAYEYDNKINPFKAIPPFLFDISSRGENNVTKRIDGINNRITAYSYTYDTDGYPVEMLYYDNEKLGGKVVFSYNK
jgi:hypothetical protein